MFWSAFFFLWCIGGSARVVVMCSREGEAKQRKWSKNCSIEARAENRQMWGPDHFWIAPPGEQKGQRLQAVHQVQCSTSSYCKHLDILFYFDYLWICCHYTMWKIEDFSATEILREINLGKVRISKTNSLSFDHYRGPKFWFLEISASNFPKLKFKVSEDVL